MKSNSLKFTNWFLVAPLSSVDLICTLRLAACSKSAASPGMRMGPLLLFLSLTVYTFCSQSWWPWFWMTPPLNGSGRERSLTFFSPSSVLHSPSCSRELLGQDTEASGLAGWKEWAPGFRPVISGTLPFACHILRAALCVHSIEYENIP